MEQEIWIDIKGYEGLYQISNLGNAKSLSRTVNHKKYGEMKISERILKAGSDDGGYLLVQLYKNDICKTHKIHRLVALHFIPNPENKPEVNHLKGQKDNRATSLEWSTTAENREHALKNGLFKVSIKRIILNTQTGIFYEGAKEASESCGIKIDNLRMKLNNLSFNNTPLIYV